MFHIFGYRSFEPEFATMKKMRELGIRTFTFMVSNNTNFMGSPYTRYQPTWVWEREYDFTKFDRNVNDLLDAVPDAGLILFLDLNPPQWWVRRGQIDGTRCDPFGEFGRIAASDVYRADTADYLQSILRHAVAAFPGRFRAVAVGGGATTEWIDRSHGVESPHRIAAWRRWREARDLPPIPIPPYEERYSGVPASGGLLRTPETHADAIDYWKCNSDMSAETVTFFLEKAREVLPADIGITLCYGYLFLKRSQCSWSQLEYERVFDRPELDFALEPISYGADERGMGGSPFSMIPMQTLKVRGKNILNSIDTTTFTSRFPQPPGHSGAVPIAERTVEWHTPAEVRAGLRREMCYNLVNGCSTWHFDMWGGWYDSDAAQETLRECRAVYEQEIKRPRKDVFEVLLVVDPENLYLVNDGHEDSTMFTRPVRRALRDSGANYTTASFRDLARMDLAPYRAVIFCHPFDLDGGKLEEIRRLCRDKTVVWIYGPGVVHDGKWDEAHVRSVCGFDFGGEAVRENGKCVYIPAPKQLAGAEMRGILRRAGAHIWTEDGAIVYATSDLAAVHGAGTRDVAVRFPGTCRRIVELFGGAEYRGTDEIGLPAGEPVTLLFRYELA